MDKQLELIWAIKRNPEEYLPERSIWALWHFLSGYSMRCHMEGLDSETRSLYPAFQAWLENRFMLNPTSHIVYEIVNSYSSGPEDAFENFYALFEEFLKAAPSSPARTQVSMPPFPKQDLCEILRRIRMLPALYVGHEHFSGVHTYIAGHERAGRDLGLPQTADEKLYDEFKLWVQRQRYCSGKPRPWYKVIRFCAISDREACWVFFDELDKFASEIGQPGLFRVGYRTFTINEYPDLRLLAGRLPAWRSVSPLGKEERSALGELNCIEVQVSNIRGDSLRFEKAIDLLNDIACSLVEQAHGRTYLVSVSHPSHKSRVKSYKGIFPRGGEIRKTDFREVEIDRGDKSFFIGIAKVDNHNRAECQSSVQNRTTAFLFVSNSDNLQYVSEKILKTVPDCLPYEKPFAIEFPKLVTNIVNEDEAVFAFSAIRDVGHWISLNIFTHKSRQAEWLVKLEEFRKHCN